MAQLYPDTGGSVKKGTVSVVTFSDEYEIKDVLRFTQDVNVLELQQEFKSGSDKKIVYLEDYIQWLVEEKKVAERLDHNEYHFKEDYWY